MICNRNRLTIAATDPSFQWELTLEHKHHGGGFPPRICSVDARHTEPVHFEDLKRNKRHIHTEARGSSRRKSNHCLRHHQEAAASHFQKSSVSGRDAGQNNDLHFADEVIQTCITLMMQKVLSFK